MRKNWWIAAAAVIAFSLPFAFMKQGSAAQRAPLRSAPPPAVAMQVNFGNEAASDDVRLIAQWVADTRDNQGLAFVILDKRDAHVYVFEPSGKLRGHSPALLGSQRGDYTVPGVGQKAIADVTPEERTTPAGRFLAEIGTNAIQQDVVWVDYDAAVAMHRVRTTVAAERRAERLATPTPDDNRISYGCINLPPQFYEDVLAPMFQKRRGVVYVLPESEPVTTAYFLTHRQGEAALASAKGLPAPTRID